MEPVLLPVEKIKLMNKKEIDAAHAIAFKALHEGLYGQAPLKQLEILRSNFNNLDSFHKSAYLQY